MKIYVDELPKSCNVTLCENIETSELEWCDNNYLVFTKEEAEHKLAEIGEKE